MQGDGGCITLRLAIMLRFRESESKTRRTVGGRSKCLYTSSKRNFPFQSCLDAARPLVGVRSMPETDAFGSRYTYLGGNMKTV